MTEYQRRSGETLQRERTGHTDMVSCLAFLNLLGGLVLDTVTRGRRELKRLIYLAADRGL
jgi:hypothetical protein